MTNTPEQEKTARLALRRAQLAPNVVIATDNLPELHDLIHSIEPRAVLSIMGCSGIRVHRGTWGKVHQPAQQSVTASAGGK